MGTKNDIFEVFFDNDRLHKELKRLVNITDSIEQECEGVNVKKVIFNDRATIVFWNDGTKTVVKASSDEPYIDHEKGVLMAIFKKSWALYHNGNSDGYYREIRRLVEAGQGDKIE